MAAFVAHPSVRIRATELSYLPVLCQDYKCARREIGVHMHCPLCTVAEAFQDPVILRAHLRIKHVDKSIDFAGLKVLRCCNHCEIVGTIKGEKRFKGAHWHCYRCRNGFNRRDEAVKHYKTHFRNPHTTFQIQVTQDVNCRQYYNGNPEANAKAYSGLAVSLATAGADPTAVSSIITSSPVLTTSSDTETTTLLTVEPKENGESNGMLLGAEEEVDSSQHTSAQTQTLVLMDHDGNTGNLIYDEATGIITEQSEESLDLQKHLLELNGQLDILRQEKESVEKSLRSEIKQLKEQIASLVQSNVKMFEELQGYRSPEHSQQRLAKLMDSLQTQHKELLQAQLASLSQEVLSQANSVPFHGHTETLALDSDGNHSQDQVKVEVQGIIAGGITGLEIIRVPLQPEQVELREQLMEFGPQDTTLSSLESTRSDTALTQDLEDKQDISLGSRKRSSEEDHKGTSEFKVPRFS